MLRLKIVRYCGLVWYLFKLPPLLGFPEGTTTNGTCVIRFSRGMFVPGEPVLPMAISYTNTNLSSNGFNGAVTDIPHLFQLASQLITNVHIKILPVVYPDEREKNDPELYANNVGTLIASTLSVPYIPKLSYKDKYVFSSVDVPPVKTKVMRRRKDI